jgi:hypothetical protein
MTATVGIDPGGAHTGVVVRSGADLLAGCVLSRSACDESRYIAEVLDVITGYAEQFGADVAIEGIVHPNPHVRIVNVAGLLDTACVYGAVLGHWPAATIVDPGGNGSAPLSCYPFDLRGAGEQRGTGWRRHLRSAWDVAGAAQVRTPPAAVRRGDLR